MMWLTRFYHWLTTDTARPLPPDQHDYDEEQRKLDEVYRRIAEAGHGYIDDRAKQTRRTPQ